MIGLPPSLSVVIPALNEEASVARTIRQIPVNELRDMVKEVEVIVVDNGSTDRTADEARAAGATVLWEPRRGYGCAYLAGFRVARGDVIVMADADGTYPLEDIARLIGPILRGEADLVTGSRLKGRIVKGAMPPLHRYIGVPFLTYLLRLLFGVQVTDAHCGFRAVRRDVLSSMTLRCEGMEFASEMLVEAARLGLRVAEVPIEYRARSAGTSSKLRTFRDGWRHLRFLVQRRITAR